MTRRLRSLTPVRRFLGIEDEILAILVAASFAVLSCAAEEPNMSGGQTGEESFGCLAASEEELARDEASPLAFSPDDVLAALGEEQQLALIWSDGTATQVTLQFIYTDGALAYQDREFMSNPSGAEIATELAVGCNDVVSIEGTLRFATDDGAFDETWPLTLAAESAALARGFYRINLAALMGTYAVSEIDPSAFDDVSAFLTLEFSADVWSGSLSGQATSSSGSGPGATVSAQDFPIAAF